VSIQGGGKYAFLFKKVFIAFICAGHTCGVTKLFLNTTNLQQYLITKDGFYTTKITAVKTIIQ
jgi:hypothetical protein